MVFAYSQIFNAPVDAAALGLFDYHQIVKQPMDLGMVKSILAKDLHPSPIEFAMDVRLTFDDETFKYFLEVYNEDIHRGQKKSLYRDGKWTGPPGGPVREKTDPGRPGPVEQRTRSRTGP
ncbi:Bromodomain-containing RNA-binding protein 1 [Forsythia ovata]|uniref:Bromodomain-containing RNA-binding protein 1 n=1 Tax=Forsythia ovata TaxID=205694 RepID=A0ABD1P416_9LAMI